MRRPHCPYCERPVGRLWFRCRVCGTRLATGYVFIVLAALAALSLLALFIFRETVEHVHP